MSKMIVLMSHKINDSQKKDAVEKYGITDFVELDSIGLGWNQIPADLDEESLDFFCDKIVEEIIKITQKGDFVFIQGEIGATFKVALFLKLIGLIPIYATTERVSQETTNPDGSVTKSNVFRHVRFRKY